jgi:hypothetical protein
MIIDLCLSEATPVILAVVVITDNEMTLHIQPGNLFVEQSISGIFTSIGEIPGDNATLGVAMMAKDVIHTAGKALGRVQAMQLLARGNQVGVGDVYEFHKQMVSECFE